MFAFNRLGEELLCKFVCLYQSSPLGLTTHTHTRLPTNIRDSNVLFSDSTRILAGVMRGDSGRVVVARSESDQPAAAPVSTLYNRI